MSAAAPRPGVSVVIVNFNGLRFMAECIASLRERLAGGPLQLIVVDNCSTDGSREWLAACPGIDFIASPVNSGFTGGNNLGASQARHELLLFINNDTRCLSSLEPLLARVQGGSADLVGCRLRYADGRQQPSFGYEHTALRILLSWLGLERRSTLPAVFRRLETRAAAYDVEQADVAWVSGACFAIRRAHWQQLGGFDTAFFMYCEDVDLCKRARDAGLRVAYTPAAEVLHYEGAGRPWIGAAALQRTARSYLVFSRKHHGALARQLLPAALGLVFLARGLAFGLLGLRSGTHQAVRRDKAGAYLSTGWQLLGRQGAAA